MGFVFFFAGAIMVLLAIKGQSAIAQFSDLIKNEFTGKDTTFFGWIGAIILIAVIGKVSGLAKTAEMLIALIIVVYLIANQGVFAKLQQALSNVQAPQPANTIAAGQEVTVVPPTAQNVPAGGTQGAGGSGGNGLQSIGTSALSQFGSLLGIK